MSAVSALLPSPIPPDSRAAAPGTATNDNSVAFANVLKDVSAQSQGAAGAGQPVPSAAADPGLDAPTPDLCAGKASVSGSAKDGSGSKGAPDADPQATQTSSDPTGLALAALFQAAVASAPVPVAPAPARAAAPAAPAGTEGAGSKAAAAPPSAAPPSAVVVAATPGPATIPAPAAVVTAAAPGSTPVPAPPASPVTAASSPAPASDPASAVDRAAGTVAPVTAGTGPDAAPAVRPPALPRGDARTTTAPAALAPVSVSVDTATVTAANVGAPGASPATDPQPSVPANASAVAAQASAQAPRPAAAVSRPVRDKGQGVDGPSMPTAGVSLAAPGSDASDAPAPPVKAGSAADKPKPKDEAVADAAAVVSPPLPPEATMGSATAQVAAALTRLGEASTAEATDGDTASTSGAPATAGSAGVQTASAAPQSGAREMVIQLDPEHLGTVEIKMRLKGGKLDVEIRVANAQTLDVLSRDRHMLASAVEAAGGAGNDFSLRGADQPPGQTSAGSQSGVGADAQPDNGQAFSSASSGSGGRGGSGSRGDGFDSVFQRDDENAPTLGGPAPRLDGGLYL